ncbi:MAG: carbon-nitrogen hydrolase family protein [Verrucomicrobiia bacterium]
MRPHFLTIPVILCLICQPARAETNASPGGAKDKVNRDLVKVAAVQISGYDKGDVWREGYDAADQLIPYIERAGQDGAQLVVFPEYILGRIPVPGPTTRKISAAAADHGLYVIVGCWEVYDDATFANTALVFDRAGTIVGKYHKTHAAVDHYEGTPAWAKPPSGKSPDWFLKNDPEWTMQRGQELPVFDLDFGRVGILTCYDGWFPETFRVISLKGAELIVWINGRRGSVEDFIMQTAMFQSHVAMVCVNQAYGTGTMIGHPVRGPTILARCPDKTESYISATIDLKAVREIRETSRNFAQRRPDLYGELLQPVGQTERPVSPGDKP